MLYSQGQNNDDFNNDNDTTVLFDFLIEEEAVQDSKGLPQFFVSDVMDEDVVCPFGLEDKKLLLYDDFLCWDEGVLVGAVSKEVISQMPKAN